MKANLSYKGYTGSCEVSFEDECLHGSILFIDDLITYEGETPKELEASFKAAVDRYVAYCAKTGKPANKPYSGTFNIRIGPQLHREVAVAAHKNDMGLNEFVTKAIEAAIENNCFAKVEHVHNHVITVKEETPTETRIATSNRPLTWEPVNATTH